MTHYLVLSFLLAYLYQVLMFNSKGYDSETYNWILQVWGNQTKEFYRYITYGWMHSVTYQWHLFINMLGIVYLGRDLENKHSHWRLLFVFILGIIVGGIVWRLLPGFGDYGKHRLAGCSAGICAWFAWQLMEMVYDRKCIQSGRCSIDPGGLLVGSLFFEIICWRIGWLSFVSHTAHLGGFFVGIGTAIWMRYSRKSQPL